MAPQTLALEEGQGKGATVVGLGKGLGGTEGLTFLSSCCDCSLAQLVSEETVEFSADDSVLKAQKYMCLNRVQLEKCHDLTSLVQH